MSVPEGCELVTADRLRPADVIVCPSGARFGLLHVVLVGERVVRLRSGVMNHEDRSRWFVVLSSTRFVRVRRDCRIDTRPDLRRGADL